MPEGTEVVVGGRALVLTNLQKLLYPAAGFTKAEVIDYYARIAPAMLPHLDGRALTMKRWPDGVEAKPFFNKRAPSHRPDWIEVVEVTTSDGPLPQLSIDDAAGLVWVANLAALELHVPLGRHRRPDRPDWLILDLDPGPPTTLAGACAIGLEVRTVLEAAGLASCPKVTGSKGVHLHVPLDGSPSDEEAKTFAHALADLLVARLPERVVGHQTRADRTGKVLVDWSQNDGRKTNICAWSLRGTPHPQVAVPVTWAEVEAVAGGDLEERALVFSPDAAVERYAERGDPLLAIAGEGRALPG